MRAADNALAHEWGRFDAQSLERRILEAASAATGAALRPRRLVLDNGNSVEIEGMDAAQQIVVQVIGNQGAYKAAYRNKVLADLFKLSWVSRCLPTVQLVAIVLTEAVLPALGGWVRTAASDMGIQVFVFDGQTVQPIDGSFTSAQHAASVGRNVTHLT